MAGLSVFFPGSWAREFLFYGHTMRLPLFDSYMYFAAILDKQPFFLVSNKRTPLPIQLCFSASILYSMYISTMYMLWQDGRGYFIYFRRLTLPLVLCVEVEYVACMVCETPDFGVATRLLPIVN